MRIVRMGFIAGLHGVQALKPTRRVVAYSSNSS